jgi:SpoVK/Ycf46/Vps4 family AAA+-type ATPase
MIYLSAASCISARKMAPCFLLLDNIEVLLGLRLAPSSSADGDTARKEKEKGKEKKETGRTRRGGSRTSHRAIDRILSTLLVELDGIAVRRGSDGSGVGSGSRGRGGEDRRRNVSIGGSAGEEAAVIVIATSSCHPGQLDR